MKEEELAAIFGPEKVATLTESGHWPVPAWLLPYILDPNPIRSEPLEFDSPEAEQAYNDLIALVSSVTGNK